MFSKHFVNKTNVYNYSNPLKNMSKKSKSKSIKELKDSSSTSNSLHKVTGPIIIKDQSVEIHIYAKPGAKQNAITDITDDSVNVQINAPPVEGSANTELVKYMASVLGLSKSHVELDRGHKSKQKVLKIFGLSLEEVKTKIENEGKSS